MANARLYRLVAVADVPGEVAADWCGSQTIPDDVTTLYARTARGFEVFALWLNVTDPDDVPGAAVVDDAAEVALEVVVALGIEGGGTRIARGGQTVAGVPGDLLPYEDPLPVVRGTYLRISAATAPVGATHLAMYVREVDA